MYDFTNLPEAPAFPFTPAQETWLTTLETTTLPQAVGKLCCDEGYCCLGIALLALGIEHAGVRKPKEVDGLDWVKYWNTEEYLTANGPTKTVDGVLPEHVAKLLNLRSKGGRLYHNPGMLEQFKKLYAHSLVSLNDTVGLTFKEIALFIRYNPTMVFNNLDGIVDHEDNTGKFVAEIIDDSGSFDTEILL